MSSVTPASGAAAAPEGAPSAAALRRADQLAARIEAALPAGSIRVANTTGEVTFELRPAQLLAAAKSLRDALGFEMLMDVCVVDYLQHGRAEWKTEHATLSGFSRGVARGMTSGGDERPGRRFGVSYHLLSIANNQRLRLKVYCEDDDQPAVDSVTAIWASADWFEREAFDLFGVMFRGHPDLRRILTDYGFIGHPFRKDFPLIGNVEVRYDPEKRRVVYQPVSIEARVLVPKVIRHDNRYNPELTAAPAASIAPVTPLIAPPPPAPPAPPAAAAAASGPAAPTAAASTPPASAKT